MFAFVVSLKEARHVSSLFYVHCKRQPLSVLLISALYKTADVGAVVLYVLNKTTVVSVVIYVLSKTAVVSAVVLHVLCKTTVVSVVIYVLSKTAVVSAVVLHVLRKTTVVNVVLYVLSKTLNSKFSIPPPSQDCSFPLGLGREHF